jgi:Ser/Thr protein kinase RdoA (MazF antagonist)
VSREDLAVLTRVLADRYGVPPEAVREFEPGGGVFHVADRGLVVRVFPVERPPPAAEHDGRVLAVLEGANLAAERLADEEPTWTLDDGRVALATQFVPGRQCRNVLEPDLLEKVATLLGRVHALAPPDDLRRGGGWHLASADIGTRSDDLAALVPQIADDRLRAAVESIDTGDGLPESLVHPDPSGANVIADPGADPTLIDWTGAGRGPRLLSFAVLLGTALDAPQVAEPIMRGYARHVELTDDELDRLPGVLCGFPLLVGAWMHVRWGTPAAQVVVQHDRRRLSADALVAGLTQ